MKNSRLFGVAKRRRENTFFQLNTISDEFGLFWDATSAAMLAGTCGRRSTLRGIARSWRLAEDSQGNLIGPGDMTAQARQVFANIGRALAAAGARPQQVTKLTIFVANYRREHLAMIEQGRIALFGDHKPADTLVGVAALSRPDYLLEVDAIAVIDNAT